MAIDPRRPISVREMNLLERSKSGVSLVAAALIVLVLTFVATVPAHAGQMHTGLRAAAIAKCKKKFPPGPQRKTCLVRASHQPQ
jgi:hypothetical protein